jgi:aspartyl-tRNA(Asn)/glutamyl-tRNA(Gln) amidotransferase subunit A
MNDELSFLPATRIADLVRHRKLSPVEITQAVLDRAHRLQPGLNCFITICTEQRWPTPARPNKP